MMKARKVVKKRNYIYTLLILYQAFFYNTDNK